MLNTVTLLKSDIIKERIKLKKLIITKKNCKNEKSRSKKKQAKKDIDKLKMIDSDNENEVYKSMMEIING